MAAGGIYSQDHVFAFYRFEARFFISSQFRAAQAEIAQLIIKCLILCGIQG